MYSIGTTLRELREDSGMQLSAAGKATGIDLTLLSRIETGKRLPTDEHLQKLAKAYGYDYNQLLVQKESDRIVNSPLSADLTLQAIRKAGAKLSPNNTYHTDNEAELGIKPIPIESRRYIGSKAKLTPWIMEVIKETTEDVHTFCDIFAGTGVVANMAATLFDKVIINDFLYSNEAIYNAFFAFGTWDKFKIGALLDFYNSVNPNNLRDNWFSENYGDKYYARNMAKHIGFIRQHIEDSFPALNTKEYYILLATLIYNIDKYANTVGHFDAYIKKNIKEQQLVLRPIEAHSLPNVEIYRDDANMLARKINADIIYIDPPYSSRQYSRFYHLYETLVKWDKPELFGVAMKPEAENMSEYCSSRAVDAFSDLVTHLNTRYIVVSYNNTYNSKSHSSENKIQLEDIRSILSSIGPTQKFDHDYRFFNTGKTDFNNHKELLFVTKVNEG